MLNTQQKLFRVVIGLGTNKPDRMTHLRCGMKNIRKIPESSVVTVSAVYESEPVGENLDNDFYNAVVVIDTNLGCATLKDVCHEIEAGCGRDREEEKMLNLRNRTLDLDIIFYGDQTIKQNTLIVPHPLWQDRSFVVMPLLDVIDDLTIHQKQLVYNVTNSTEYCHEYCRRVKFVLD